jgi:hypothetical protein
MAAKLSPLKDYPQRTYPKAKSTAVGKILLAASMAATSLGGCGPAVDRGTVDAAVDKSDLDSTLDGQHEAAQVDHVVTDTAPDQAADAK